MSTIIAIIADFFGSLANWCRTKAQSDSHRSLTGEREADALIAPWWWLVILVALAFFGWLFSMIT